MNKKYIFPVIILLLLGAILLLIPHKDNSQKELSAEQLLLEMNGISRFFSTEKVADIMINKNPYLLLIDIRPQEKYKEFHLPGAINIPIDSFLTETWKPYLNQIAMNNIFYSNGTSLADAAWMICRRQNFNNNYVLEGGLNAWVETVLKPEKPVTDNPSEEFNKYQQQKGASIFFGGGDAGAESNITAPVPKVQVKKKKKVQGGC